MNIVVIEPHADDAFLSLGGHISMWKKEGHSVTIATIYCKEKRRPEAEAYADTLGVKSLVVGLPEGDMGVTQAKNAARIPGSLVTELAGSGTLVAPLGLQHPEHLAVRKAFHPKADWLYAEIPYYIKQVNGADVVDKAGKHAVKSILRPHASKWRHYKLFKSQAKFFHFNPVENFYNTPEIILWK